jgi:ABC-type sugar transport system substrate-binding protein
MDSQTAMWTRDEGKKVMKSFIDRFTKENIQAVYAHNDDMALGAIQALKEAGLKPGVDVIVVSIDGIRDALTAVKDGELGATVECTPLLGPKTFEVIDRILKGERMQKRHVTESRLFDQSNAAQELPNRQY